MTTARRRALVGLISLALVASAQAGMATSAIAADAPVGTAAVGTTAVTFTTAPQPSITGTAQVGSTLFAVTGTWAPQPDSFTFKWWSNGLAISGATGSAYTLVAADLGKKITLTVTANKAGYTSLAKSSAATATVAAAPSPVAFTTVPTPTISGTPKVGTPLTAATGTWAPVPTTFAYRWFVANVAVTGATASTYTPVAADVGKRITVTVTGSRSGYTTAAKTSAASAAVAAAPVTTPATFTTVPTPTLTGSAQVGGTLTAVPGTWAPVPTTFTYRWFAANVAISGATASTYSPVAADLGKRITVTVTGARSGYTTASKTSAVSAAVVTAPVTSPSTFTTVPTPTLSGTAQVGTTLTAAPGTWVPVPTTFTYRWFASNVGISGATASTYVPVAADVGKRITVTVTGARSGYTSASKTSAGSAAVVAAPAAKAFAIASSPTISGSASVGGVLTAATGSWSPAPAFTYQWTVGTTAITGATGSTYTVGTADLGKTITVTITAKATGYITTSKTSVATAAVGKPAIASTQPVIVGDARVGYPLRVVPGIWNPKPSFTFVWYANDVKIDGANAQDYTPGSADIGKRITATVTGTAPSYSAVARTSGRTAAVVGMDTQPPEQPWNGKVVGNVYLDFVDPQNLVTEGNIDLVKPEYGWADYSAAIGNGAYSMSDIRPREYGLRVEVEVAGEYIIQYFGQTNDLKSAQTFAVQSNGTMTIDVVVKRYASVSGTVSATDELTGDVPVSIFRTDGDGAEVGATRTDWGGRFTVRDIVPGTYKVRFGSPTPNDGAVVGEWFGDSDTRASGKTVTVSQWGQAVIGVNAVLTPGTRLAGQITSPTGSLGGAQVSLVPQDDLEGLTTMNVTADAGGYYAFPAIAPGKYKVLVSSSRSSAPVYETRWAGGTGSLETSTTYTAARGTPMPRVDVQLAVSPSVTVQVTGLAAAGWDPDRALVSLYQDGVRKFYSWAWNGDPAFLRDLTPGTYNVAITYYDADYNAKAYWWNGGVYADKSEIVVRAGDSISIVAKAVTRVAPAGAQLVR
ncbi:carboxypeptidase regulatory-like domain-containing protein [Clavibacter nebraskensis]|uniref:carboxypeptidase regulatory-like domain-containing protein n=1 Tax=Clavibacter nebraskensis TaxID=31963 RepID=UPI001F3B8521|nr:carboxypeptidase regulatory-like domain-containing protein [Clavibacter nebraskensis]UKF28143.1 carboxypeptidase regulatory-like domain-containing protein [Clavibacter nebraskensis]UQB16675.1 carboxypeptidase regulatory-like domain-containing protein [Clavibacter nebraskensis]